MGNNYHTGDTPVYEKTANKDVASGYPSLDSTGKIPTADILALTTQQPTDQGLLAWSFPAEYALSAGANTLGFLVLTKIKIPKTISVTNLITGVVTAGASLTSNQCLAGLWTSGGTLIGSTADQSAVWNSTGLKTMPLTGGPFPVTGGDTTFVYAGFLANGSSTVPAFSGISMNGLGLAYSAGLAAATYLAAYQGGGLTALPSPLVPGSNNLYSGRIWAALS